MPYTPYHLGVGLLAKGALPERVSLLAFAASQVVIDCETAYYLVKEDWPVHRWCHTFVVGVPVGLASGILLWGGVRFLGPLWRRLTVRPARPEVALVPCLLGGGLGGATHPVLDGIMHWDIRPFLPFSPANPLLGALGLPALHLACVGLAVFGLVLLAVRGRADSVYARS